MPERSIEPGTPCFKKECGTITLQWRQNTLLWAEGKSCALTNTHFDASACLANNHCVSKNVRHLGFLENALTFGGINKTERSFHHYLSFHFYMLHQPSKPTFDVGTVLKFEKKFFFEKIAVFLEREEVKSSDYGHEVSLTSGGWTDNLMFIWGP